MELLKINLKELVEKSASSNNLFKRNILKEYLQVVVLNFIYSHPRYNQLYFYGGSCLAQCFGLPRLSEDLDFIDSSKKINLLTLAHDLEKYFNQKTDLSVKATIQKFRIYLKFPILHELGLTQEQESNLLFLKVEIFSEFNFCSKYKTEIIPLFKFNRSILIRTFDLPTLMTTKIRAILYRQWEKTDTTGKTLIKVKGRDYFDLMWYLEKNIKPNLACLNEVKNLDELKEKLKKIILKIDYQSIKLDLEFFIDDQSFINGLSKNLKDILIRDVEMKL